MDFWDERQQNQRIDGIFPGQSATPSHDQSQILFQNRYLRERFRRPALPTGSIDRKSGLPDDANMMTGQDSWTDSQFRAAIPMTLIEQFLQQP
ncbi:MAG: hypothetical protein ACFNXZ_02130 [Lautropia mirabilis]